LHHCSEAGHRRLENLVEIHGPVWIEGGFDSSHGGYHRTARESCRRGYAEVAFILDFLRP
jgi:hypothetical protein